MNSRDALDQLRAMLRGATTSDHALTVLSVIDAAASVALVGDLLDRATSHRDALRVRELLGRLPASDAERYVGLAVVNRLPEADADEYRRYAELLAHLGLRDALSQLVDSARRSSDDDVLEVAEDFG